MLDDASDTTTAVANTRKLITENKVDIVLGSTTTPNSLAMIDVVAEAQTPMISMAASARIVEPVDAKKQLGLQDAAERHHDVARDRRRTWPPAASRRSASSASPTPTAKAGSRSSPRPPRSRGCTIVANERYARTDTSVTGQVLKLVARQARRGADRRLRHAGRAAAATLKERGYAGKYYQTHGVANNDFLRVGGKDVEGTLLPAGPVLVAGAAAGEHTRCKKSALDYVAKYEAANGKGSVSTFGAHAWDAGLLMSAAVPAALKKAQPGTPEFRAALRDALEKVKELPGAHGIFNMSPTDHLGLDQRARVMVKIENGTWKYQP